MRLVPIALAIVCACSPAHEPATARPASSAGPPDFSYAAAAPLDVIAVGEPTRWDTVTIAAITYASPRGGRVPALVVAPVGPGTRRAAVVMQHGMGALDKTELLPDAVALAETGMVCVLIDAPDQRPAALRSLDYADHSHDRELWEHATVDLRRAIDVVSARADVDPARIGFVGHSFGATQGAILAAIEPRLRAAALIAPGDLTRGIRESQAAAMVGLRAHVPPAALAGYLEEMAPLDASRFVARAPRSIALLLQLGAYDAGSSAAADAAFAAASTARTETRRYPTGHFIFSIPAARDRIEFLVHELS